VGAREGSDRSIGDGQHTNKTVAIIILGSYIGSLVQCPKKHLDYCGAYTLKLYVQKCDAIYDRIVCIYPQKEKKEKDDRSVLIFLQNEHCIIILLYISFKPL
jgi:hypothetical protein